jgi:iron complex outermembrane receptor protein
MKDRVVLSGQFAASDDPGDPFGMAVQSIVSPFPGVGIAQFFVNAVDTTTDGLDLVLDYTHRLPKGVIKATAAANFTRTTVDEVNVPASMEQMFAAVPGGSERVRELFLGRYGRNLLEDLRPRRKGTLGVRGDHGRFSGGVRANYFGPTVYRSDYTDADGNFLDESFGSEVTFDVDLGLRLGGLWWSIGGNNVFNNFPDQVKREENRNNETFIYSPVGNSGGAPYGIEGAFYYVRAAYKF